MLKRSSELRALYLARKGGVLPTDEQWLSLIWPAVFPAMTLSLTDGHVRSVGNGMNRLQDWERLQRAHAGHLTFGVHFFEQRHSVVGPSCSVVPWCVEAALLVLDLLRDEFEACLSAALAHHRVRRFPEERRRRKRDLPEFSFDRFLDEGFGHLARQMDPRFAQPPSCMWALPMLVETMLEIPPHVRRLWAKGERLALGAESLSDAWGHHYARDVVEQLPLTLARRIVDDGYSRHPLAASGAVADLDAIEREWANVSDLWSPSFHLMPEPMIPRESLYRLVGDVNAAVLGRDACKSAHRLLDDMANWMLVRLVGVNVPSRMLIDDRTRREGEVMLGVLLRRHFGRADAPDWATAYDSGGTRGSLSARRQHAEIWLALESIGAAVKALRGERTFLAAVAAWRPNTCSDQPARMLLRRARDLRHRDERGGIAAAEVLLDCDASSIQREDHEDEDGRIAQLRQARAELPPDDQAIVDAMMAGEVDADEMPTELRERLKALLST